MLRLIGGSRGLWIVLIFVIIGLIVVWLKVVRGSEDPTSGLATFVAKRGPLIISIPESGTIKAREKIIIKNEIEGRTSIVSLVPEGTHVKKGDLLIELDASVLEDSKIDQEIAVQKAYAAFIDANETLAVVENQAQSDLDVAKLTLDFAKQDLEQYEEGQYPNEKTAAENDITLREEELKRTEETLVWSQKLYDQKYISQTELLADKLAVTRSNNNLELAQNNLKLLENFTYHRQIAQLKSDFKQATMALERTERKSRALVIQAEADLKAKDLEYKRQKDKFDKIEDQIKKAKIYSPTDAMVIYATTARRGGWRDRREPMDIGIEVTERQELFHLPTAQSAMVEVDIHEASLEKVQLGLPAVITVDALPGQKFLGSVQRIAPLPDPQSMWMNPDLKVYNSDIYLEGNVPSLRTGMSCKVEIIVEQYDDAVYVPVHTVLRVGGESTVFVVKGGSIEERKVNVGLDNRRMIRIISGLDEGELVLQAPPLKSAALEPGSQMVGTTLPDASDTLKQRINEKLEEANGTDVRRPPSMPSEGVGGSQREGGGRPVGRGQERPGREGVTSEQREKMRKRLENMSPEERQKEIEKMRRRFENMSPEERQRMQERSQSGPSGEGRRPRQRGREGNP
jgi:HlyD family secretion protein